LKPDKGWRRRFEDPIPLPRGRKLVTLQDAGNYITKLPKAEHEAPEWRAAMESLLLVMELDGPTMFARIGIRCDMLAETCQRSSP
jgi:hypothetical protein